MLARCARLRRPSGGGPPAAAARRALGTVLGRLSADGVEVDYLKEIVNARVYDVAQETALTPARRLSAELGCSVLIKREDTQPVFSFKIRGAYNKIVQLSEEERARGVVACSAGNHAQGVALSCRTLKTRGVIVMPLATPTIKVEAVAAHGGEFVDVRLHGNAYDDAAAEATRLVVEEGLTLIHPFDDPKVIAGQGTIGAEIVKQLAGRRLDAIFCCCGGGGLAAGIAAFVKRVRPDVKVYAVEAEDSAGMKASLDAGERTALTHVGLFADGAAVKLVGRETFRICHALLDGVVTVTNDEICAAIKAGFSDTRIVLEPAGALAIAGVRKYVSENHTGSDADRKKQYVVISSGANMDFDRLRFVAERADRSEVRLAVKVPERPGAFRELYQTIFPCNVTEFSYRFNQHATADIIVAFQPKTQTWFQRLSTKGYEPRDITGDDLVKNHLRHLAGGHAPPGLNERVLRFEFPEAPGALNRFLAALQPDGDQTAAFNVSLFHYRNHGADFGRVLVGVQVPPGAESSKKFDDFLANVGYRYVEETDNQNYRQFLG